MNLTERIENAIRWIDSLDPKEGYKKTTNKLGRIKQNRIPNSPKIYFDEVKNFKEEAEYCCLGVACLSMNMQGRIDLNDTYDKDLEFPLGLNESSKFKNENGDDVRIEFNRDGTSNWVRHTLPIKGYDYYALPDVNDRLFRDDKDFSRIREFILDNLRYIFIPRVAEALKVHYKK